MFLQIACTTSVRFSVDECDTLLWNNPDSCIVWLEQMDTMTMDERSVQLYHLKLQHAYFRTVRPNDMARLASLADYFVDKGEPLFAGEAYSIIGRVHLFEDNTLDAVFYLKQAEQQLLQSQANNPLLGIVYYYLGQCSENERLFEIALRYYQQALPYFKSAQNPLFLSSCYREIARCTDDSCVQTALLHMDSAIAIVQEMLPNSIDVLTNMEVSRQIFILHADTTPVLPQLRWLSDSTGFVTSARILSEYYLKHGMPDSALRYIGVLEAHIGESYWFNEQYWVQKSGYLYATGAKDSAYLLMEQLHERQTHDIENSAHSRVYMVEQFYDAERERTNYLQEQTRTQRAYLILSLFLIIALLAGGWGLFLYLRARNRMDILVMSNQHLLEQLSAKREALVKQLSIRVEIAKQIQKQEIAGEQPSSAQWQNMMNRSLSFTPAQWQTFATEFDAVFDNMLVRLQSQYASITQSDLQMVAMICLDCSTETIGILLDLSKQIIWNRKARIKHHLQLPPEVDLREWLLSYASHSPRPACFPQS